MQMLTHNKTKRSIDTKIAKWTNTYFIPSNLHSCEWEQIVSALKSGHFHFSWAPFASATQGQMGNLKLSIQFWRKANNHLGLNILISRWFDIVLRFLCYRPVTSRGPPISWPNRYPYLINQWGRLCPPQYYDLHRFSDLATAPCSKAALSSWFNP